ncbi:zinc ribbon domain-containing protein [Candidatus Neomarinimicrobiota bacterium]
MVNKELKLDLNKIELRVKEDNQKIDHLKDQLFKVTTNKQYDALMLEIDHLKERLDIDETEDIELMEEKDTLEEQIKNQEKNVESVSIDLLERRESLEKMLQESAVQKKQLESDRNQLVDSIEPHVLKRYNVVRQARQGTAVVPVLGASCSGCGAVVPPQKIAEIRADKTPYACDECSRFLFIEN